MTIEERLVELERRMEAMERRTISLMPLGPKRDWDEFDEARDNQFKRISDSLLKRIRSVENA